MSGKVGSGTDAPRVDPSQVGGQAVEPDVRPTSGQEQLPPRAVDGVEAQRGTAIDAVANRAPTIAAPREPRKADASGESQVLAQVGDRAIRPEDLEPHPQALRAVNTPVFSFGAELGVEMGAEETPEAWLARLRSKALETGNLEQFETLLAYRDQELWTLQQRALEDAVTISILETGLARENVTMPPNLLEHQRLPEMYRAYVEARATALGEPVASRAVQDDVETWLNTEFERAFWAPHEAKIFDALDKRMTADERVVVRDALYGMFAPNLGFSAPGVIAEQLSQPGSPANQLVDLMVATQQVSWTAADLAQAARAHTTLEPVVANIFQEAGIQDPNSALLSHVQVYAGFDGLEADLIPADVDGLQEVWDSLRAGSATMEPIPGGGLELQGDFDEDLTHYATLKLNAAIAVLANEVRDAFDNGQSVSSVLQNSPLVPLNPGEDVGWLQDNPLIVRALEAEVLERVDEGLSQASISQALQPLGLSNERTEALSALGGRLSLLGAVAPLSPALRELTSGRRNSIDVPLDGERATSRDTQETIATLQEHFLAAGFLNRQDIASFGALDSVSTEQLLGLSSSEEGLDLSAETLASLRIHAAKKLRVDDISVAEVLLTHPALRRYREEGGHGDAIRFVNAYLAAQQGGDGGVTLGAEELTGDSLNLLHSSSTARVDDVIYQRALALLPDTPPTPREDYDRVMGTKAQRNMTPPYGFGVIEQMTAEERTALNARLAHLTQPSFVTAVPRGELGMLPIYQPIVALKLARANLSPGSEPPIDGTGTIDAVLSDEDLAFWRTLLVHEGASPDERAQAWDRVVESARQGELTIGDLTQDVDAQDIPGHDAQRAADINMVLQDLRAAVEIVRLNTQANDEAVASTSGQRRQFQPIRKFARPLEAALDRFGESYGLDQPSAAGRMESTAFESLDSLASDLENVRPVLEAMLAQQTALDDAGGVEDNPTAEQAQALEALESAAKQKDDIVSFLERYEAARGDIEAVQSALDSGALTIMGGSGEQVAALDTSDPSLRRQARAVVELFVDGAEILQTEARQRNSHLGAALLRSGMEVRHHLLTLPGFADVEPLNALQDEHVLAFKITHSGTEGVGVATSPYIDPESLGVVRKGESAWSTERRGELANVDADLIRALLEPRYAHYLGEGWVQKATSGLSLPLADPAEAKVLLERVADSMEEPWSTVNITFEDRDPEVRQAKLLVQSALAQLFQTGDILGEGLVPGREFNAAKDFMERLWAMDTQELGPSLKSFVILNGLSSVEDAGDLHDPTFGPQVIKGLLVVANDSFPNLPEHMQEEAQRHFDTLKAIAARGESVEFGEGEGGVALKRLNITLLGGGTSEGRLKTFDFDKIVGSRTTDDFSSWRAYAPGGGTGEIRVRHIRGNQYGAATADIRGIDLAVGQDVETSERIAEQYEQWSSRVRFDSGRALETAGASWVLFHKLMHTMISYDMLPKPLIKSGRAVSHWASGETNTDEMWTEVGHAWQEPANLLAMLTAFKTGIGFVEDVGDQVRQGNLDLALGKGAVFAPMLYGSLKGMWWMGRKGVTRIDRAFRSGSPYQVQDVSLVDTRGSTTSSQRVGVPSQIAGRAVQGLGFTWEAGTNPTATIKEGVGALRRSIHTPKGVQIGSNAAFNFELSPEHRTWIAENRGGTTSFTVSKGLTSHRLALPNTALLEAAHYPDGRFPDDLSRRLGLHELPDRQQMARAIAEMTKELPRVPIEELQRATRGVPSLETLRQNAQGTSTYELSRRTVTLTNANALKLIRTANTTPARLERAALAVDLTLEEARQLADSYSDESRRAMKQADRYALGTNWTERTAANLRGRGRAMAGRVQRWGERLSGARQRLAGRNLPLAERLLVPSAMSYQPVELRMEGMENTRGAQVYRSTVGGVDFRVMAAGEQYRIFANSVDVTGTVEGRALVAEIETSDRVLTEENYRNRTVRIGGETVNELYRYATPDGTVYQVVHGRKGTRVFSRTGGGARQDISRTAFGQRILHQLDGTEARTGAVRPADVERARTINEAIDNRPANERVAPNAQNIGSVPPGIVAEMLARNPEVLTQQFPEIAEKGQMSEANRAKVRTWVEANWNDGAKLSTNPEVVAYLQSNGTVSKSFLVNQISNGNALHAATLASFLAAEGMFRVLDIEDHHFAKLATGMGLAGLAGYGLNRYGASASPGLAHAQSIGATRMERARNLIKGQVRGFGPAMLGAIGAGSAFREGTLYLTDLDEDHWFVEWGTLTASVSGAIWGPPMASRAAAGLTAWSQPARARVAAGIAARLGETGMARYLAAFAGEGASAATAGRVTMGQVASKILLPLTFAELGAMGAEYFDSDYETFENKLMVSVRQDVLDLAFSDGDTLTAAELLPLAALNQVENFLPAWQEQAGHWTFYEMAHSRGVLHAGEVDNAIRGEIGSQLLQHLDVNPSDDTRDDYLSVVLPSDFDGHAWAQSVQDLANVFPSEAETIVPRLRELLTQAHILSEGYPHTVRTAAHMDGAGRIEDPEALIEVLLGTPLQTASGELTLSNLILEERRRSRVAELVRVLDEAKQLPAAERDAFLDSRTTTQDRDLGLVSAARRAREAMSPNHNAIQVRRERLAENVPRAEAALQIGIEIAAVDRALTAAVGQDADDLASYREDLVANLSATGYAEERTIEVGEVALDDLATWERLHGKVQGQPSSPGDVERLLRRMGPNFASATPEPIMKRALLDLDPNIGADIQGVAAELDRVHEKLQELTLVARPDSPERVPGGWANRQADNIAGAIDRLGTTEEAFLEALEREADNPAKLRAVRDAFAQRHGEKWVSVTVAALREMTNDKHRMRRAFNAMQMADMEPDRARDWMRDRVARAINKDDTDWLEDELGPHELRAASRQQHLTLVRMLLEDNPDRGQTLHRVLEFAAPEDLAWVLEQVSPIEVVKQLSSDERIRDVQRWIGATRDRELLKKYLEAAAEWT